MSDLFNEVSFAYSPISYVAVRSSSKVDVKDEQCVSIIFSDSRLFLVCDSSKHAAEWFKCFTWLKVYTSQDLRRYLRGHVCGSSESSALSQSFMSC